MDKGSPNKPPRGSRDKPGRPGEALNPGDEAPPGTTGAGEDLCPVCGGSGRASGRDCPNCGGSGRVIEGIGGG
jgi:hypothetical protein